MTGTSEVYAAHAPRQAEGAAPSEAPAGCTADVVDFDFDAKSCTKIGLGDVGGAIAAGRFVWVDLDARERGAAKVILSGLGLLQDPTIEELFSGDPGTQLMRYETYLHLVLATCAFDEAGALSLERLDVLLGERFLITVHEGPRMLIDGVKRDYRGDFVRFAKTPSFLLYELWDHLTDHYISVQKRLEKRVEQLQVDLLRAVDEQVFAQVSDIGVALLHFRSLLMPARAVLTELSTRRMVFISEATQAFLSNMVGTIERVLQDVLVDRDSLAQSLNLTMSMVSHRTSRAMTKLTILSTIFLPLTFLCGVYGMNFEYLPELRWRFGYGLFWLMVSGIVGVALWLVRRSRMF